MVGVDVGSSLQSPMYFRFRFREETRFRTRGTTMSGFGETFGVLRLVLVISKSFVCVPSLYSLNNFSVGLYRNRVVTKISI